MKNKILKISGVILTLVIVFFVSPLPNYLYAKKLSKKLFGAEKITMKQTYQYKDAERHFHFTEFTLSQESHKTLLQKKTDYWQKIYINPSFDKMDKDVEYHTIQWADSLCFEKSVKYDIPKEVDIHYGSQKNQEKITNNYILQQKVSGANKAFENSQTKYLIWRAYQDEGHLTDYIIYLLDLKNGKVYYIDDQMCTLFY